MLKKKNSQEASNKAAEQAAYEQELKDHPLYPVFMSAIHQVMYGKGERHGGGKIPFMDQDWVRLGQAHGRGFLTGQACKKITEAAETRHGTDFEIEMLGAIVYAGMAVIHERNRDGEQ